VTSLKPSIAVDGHGYVHVVWSERTPGQGWGTAYRVRDGSDPVGSWSAIETCNNDDGIIRLNSNRFDQQPHIAVNPNTDEVGIVFNHRNPPGFYFGDEQGCVFFNHTLGNRLRPVSGMADHLVGPQIVFNPYVYDDFFVFWSQHHNMSDYDHDIWYNYRATETYGSETLTGWQFVKRASDTPLNSVQFGPAIAVNNSVNNGSPTDKTGDMYLVTYDYTDFGEGRPLTFTRFDKNNGWQAPDLIDNDPNTDKAWTVDIAYYFDPSEPDEHNIVIVYMFKHTSPKRLYVIKTPNPEPEIEIEWTTVADFPISDTDPVFSLDVDRNGNFYVSYVAPNNGVYVRNVTQLSEPIMEVAHNCKRHESLDIEFRTDDANIEQLHFVYSESDWDDHDDKMVYWTRYAFP